MSKIHQFFKQKTRISALYVLILVLSTINVYQFFGAQTVPAVDLSAGSASFTTIYDTDFNMTGDLSYGAYNRTDILANPNQPYDYIIWVSGSTYYAKSCSTGQIAYKSTNASYVWNNVLNTGTSIYVEDGNYTLTTQIRVTSSHHYITGESTRVNITSAILPCFNITGGALDSGLSINDLVVENIYFYYVGLVTTGHFISVSGVQNDGSSSGGKYQGQILFKNINLRSSQGSSPTDDTFVGFYLTNAVGVIFDSVNIMYFGTSLEINGGALQSDMITLYDTNLSHGKHGIYIRGNINRVTAINLKIMFMTEAGIYKTVVNGHTYLLSPQFESMTAFCIYNYGDLTVNTGVFSTFITGIYFGLTGHPELTYHLVVMNTEFYSGTTAINLKDAKALLIGNYYQTVTNKVSVSGICDVNSESDEYVTKNSFSGANTTATTAVINHGLAGAADFVWCSFNTSAITGYTWSSSATQVTITPTGTLPASWICYVRAEYKP